MWKTIKKVINKFNIQEQRDNKASYWNLVWVPRELQILAPISYYVLFPKLAVDSQLLKLFFVPYLIFSVCVALSKYYGVFLFLNNCQK